MTKLKSQFVDIDGVKLHYLEAGSGPVMLFLHGMPTSSYLWRNIIPVLSDKARCIAPDFVGMGKSDKPDIAYTVFDHIHYIEKLIEKLELKNITLVMHGWGSVVGFDIASRNEANIHALAFYEAHVRPSTEWDMLSLPVQQLATLLHRREASYRAIVEQNYLIRRLLPSSVLRTLTAEEMQRYEEPFLTPEDRKPLWQFIQELPLGHQEGEIVELISRYNEWLRKTKLQKLMFYAIPGFITTMESVRWSRENLPKLTLVELQNALHMAQETMPEFFAKELRAWFVQTF